MNNEMNNNDAPDFDDHEPGDVNGNVDPAWAKKQKQKAKNDVWKAKRSQKQGGRAVAAASDTPGESREMTVASESPVAEGSAEVVAAIEVGATAPHAGDRWARGPRRFRRGGRREPQETNENGSNTETPEHSGVQSSSDSNQYESKKSPSPEQLGRAESEFEGAAFEGNRAGEDELDPSNPNPGAFGDPNRPMDRTGRRSRNRFRNREKSDRGRAIRQAKQQAEGAAQPAEDGAQSADEVGASRDGERLHKVLAQQGLGSRRAMEAMIESGEVEVNGEPAKVGQVVNESDRVYVRRRKVTIKLGDDKPRILIYHKPAGEIVTRDDPEARDTVFDRLPRPDHGKWIAIGRLDFNTEGLLLFTTSGELANRMMHPRYEILREYSVRVLGELEPEQEDQLIDGIELDDGPARVLSLDRIDRDSEGANHWYRITINEGRNREVRRMFEHLGLTVSRLIRTRYGAVNMPSWLKRGQYKVLDENDTFNVLESVGMRSRKKLEKAARFGGARGKLPQGPVGPMRSATEHESIWNGAPAASANAIGGRNERRGNRNARGRVGGMRGESAGASLSLQQQQFPGFGGASDAASPAGQRRARGKAKRGRGGEVNGNVDPNFRAGRGVNPRRGRGRNSALSTPPEFDEEGNRINVAPPAGDEGQARQARNPRGQNRGNARGNVGGQRGPRGRNRRGRGPRDGSADPNALNGVPAEGVPSDNAALSDGAAENGNIGVERQPRGRGRRNPRRGGRGRGPREGQGSDNVVVAPAASDSDKAD